MTSQILLIFLIWPSLPFPLCQVLQLQVSISSTFTWAFFTLYVQIFRTNIVFLVTFWLCWKIRTKKRAYNVDEIDYIFPLLFTHTIYLNIFNYHCTYNKIGLIMNSKQSISLDTVWLCNFLAPEYRQKNLLVKMLMKLATVVNKAKLYFYLFSCYYY